MIYAVDATEPTALVVNQRMYPGWRLTHGNGFAYAENGLIAVYIPAGRQEIELTYTPRRIRLAFEIALFAFAMLLLVWGIEMHRTGDSSDQRARAGTALP